MPGGFYPGGGYPGQYAPGAGGRVFTYQGEIEAVGLELRSPYRFRRQREDPEGVTWDGQGFLITPGPRRTWPQPVEHVYDGALITQAFPLAAVADVVFDYVMVAYVAEVALAALAAAAVKGRAAFVPKLIAFGKSSRLGAGLATGSLCAATGFRSVLDDDADVLRLLEASDPIDRDALQDLTFEVAPEWTWTPTVPSV